MFIVFEGIDGSGKSSAARAAADFLRARGKKITFAPDPGGTELSLTIRQILLDNRRAGIAPLAELSLYCAARAQLLAEIIHPALARGEIVIGDRFIWSTLAYQGEILPAAQLRPLVFAAAGNFFPDFTILLDLPAQTAMTRLNRDRDRIENRGETYLENVRRRYLETLASIDPERWTLIDATQSVADVNAKISAIIAEKITVKTA